MSLGRGGGTFSYFGETNVRCDFPRQGVIDGCQMSFGISHDGGSADIGLLADARVQWNVAENFKPVSLCFPHDPVRAKDVGLVIAFGADKVTHVLNHPEHLCVCLFEHVDASDGIDQGDILRRGDDGRAVEDDLLRDGQLHVARAGRHVEDQDVEAAPTHLVEELLDGLHDHESAPDDGTVRPDEEAHRHCLDAVVLQGQ